MNSKYSKYYSDRLIHSTITNVKQSNSRIDCLRGKISQLQKKSEDQIEVFKLNKASIEAKSKKLQQCQDIVSNLKTQISSLKDKLDYDYNHRRDFDLKICFDEQFVKEKGLFYLPAPIEHTSFTGKIEISDDINRLEMTLKENPYIIIIKFEIFFLLNVIKFTREQMLDMLIDLLRSERVSEKYIAKLEEYHNETHSIAAITMANSNDHESIIKIIFNNKKFFSKYFDIDHIIVTFDDHLADTGCQTDQEIINYVPE